MTHIFCEPTAAAIASVVVEHELWQSRARNAGLRQKVLAMLLGVTEITVSRQLRGKWESGEPPRYVKTVIRAWEMLTPEQREALIAAADADRDSI